MVVFAVMNENYPSFKHIKIINIKNMKIKNIVLGKKSARKNICLARKIISFSEK